MDIETLHERGWRQGSVFAADLAVHDQVLVDGIATSVPRSFALWVVASQDCDLDGSEVDDNNPGIEIRPAVPNGADFDVDWGIRSRYLRLSAEIHVRADTPRLLISPKALHGFEVGRREKLTDSRALAFKTWLGLRYDRPAVPSDLVELAKAIAQAVKSARSADVADQTHDVLMQFDASRTPPWYFLAAVITTDADADAVRAWLARAALSVPAELGVMGADPAAVPKTAISLDFIEQSYSADLSGITWRKSGQVGA